MKKNDIALIILIAAVCLGLGYLAGRLLIPSDRNSKVMVEVVEPISSTVPTPDTRIFNADANNPGVPITIGTPSNQKPFNGN